jgi:hypothetical protein
MALPKLNESPHYEMVIPSTKKKVRYRPFLVKEEKNLMIAMESKDTKAVIHTLLGTIESCVEDSIITSNLCTFDVEYMFLQIRSKSVGEKTKINVACQHCEAMNEHEVDIDTIDIQVPEVEKTIQITDDIAVEIDWPTYASLSELDIMSEDQNTGEVFKIMQKCFKSINTADERIDTKDVSPEELNDFIESMTSAQFAKIKEFVEKMPKLQHEMQFTCKECGHENKITVEGLTGFLS